MPCLSQLMECHVNVDVCFTVNIFMYLYKYLFKGPDRTRFTVGEQNAQEPNSEIVNEIEDYIAALYLSASEAAWQILSFHITRKELDMSSIYIHLPNTNFSRRYQTDQPSSSGS